MVVAILWKQRLHTLAAVRKSLLRVQTLLPHTTLSSSSSSHHCFFHVSSSCIQQNVSNTFSGPDSISDSLHDEKKILSSSSPSSFPLNNAVVAGKEKEISIDLDDLDNLDMEEFNKLFDEDKTNITFTASGKDFSLDELKDIMDDDDETDDDYDDGNEHFDLEDEAFENDEFIKKIMQNIDPNDEENLDLRMKMIDQRIEELTREIKKEMASLSSPFDGKKKS